MLWTLHHEERQLQYNRMVQSTMPPQRGCPTRWLFILAIPIDWTQEHKARNLEFAHYPAQSSSSTLYLSSAYLNHEVLLLTTSRTSMAHPCLFIVEYTIYSCSTTKRNRRRTASGKFPDKLWK